MNYKVRVFGIAREIMGGNQVELDVAGSTVADLRQHLTENYPELIDLKSLFIAVNHNYADDQTELRSSDEIAVIPPVSGG